MSPWLLLFGGLGLLIAAVALIDDGPHEAPEGSSPELIEWQEFLRSHRELIH
jgi:hypothetical protein